MKMKWKFKNLYFESVRNCVKNTNLPPFLVKHKNLLTSIDFYVQKSKFAREAKIVHFVGAFLKISVHSENDACMLYVFTALSL